MYWKAFREMPYLLKILILLFLFFPVLVVFSTISGTVILDGVVNAGGQQSKFGAAESFTELALFFAAALIMPMAAVMALMRVQASKIVMPLVWLVSSAFSPFVLSVVRYNAEEYTKDFLSYFIVAVLILGYMNMSKDVRNYFKSGSIG